MLSGLSRSPKQLSAKYFYDTVGSQLFDAITELSRILSDPHSTLHPSFPGPARDGPPVLRPRCLLVELAAVGSLLEGAAPCSTNSIARQGMSR